MKVKRNIGRKMISFVSAFVLLLTFVLPAFAASGFAGGTGTKTDPYRIQTAEQLAYLASSVNAGTNYSGKFIQLNNNIIINPTAGWQAWGTPLDDGSVIAPEEVWTPIGKAERTFQGSFDGKGYTVSGIYINGSEKYSGLFGLVTGSGSVANLRVTDSYIKGSSYTGAVVGFCSGTISNCYNTATVCGSGEYAGGVAAYCSGNLRSCKNFGTVSGTDRVGGVVGHCGGAVMECLNGGDVNGSDWYTGGIAGSCEGFVTESYNAGTVNGKADTGGVAGTGTVTNCYNIGDVRGSQYVGGVSGNGIVKYSYNTGTVSGSFRFGGIAGYCDEKVTDSYYLDICVSEGANTYGLPLTETQMKTESAYVGFDFDNIWVISSAENNGYPTLMAVPVEKAPCSHNYVPTVTEPTCTEGGYTTYECSLCHDTYIAAQTAPKGHTPGEWITDVAASCLSQGLRHKECTVCHAVLQSETVDALGHSFTDGECVRCHIHQYTVTVSYVFSDGSTASPTVSETRLEGESYAIVSPVIENYTPDILIVSGVAEKDSPVVVTYTKTEQGGSDAETYTVTVKCNDDTMGAAVASPITAEAGTVITLQAAANTGCHFVRWESGDVTVSEDAFTMPAKNVTVTAVFAKDEPTPPADDKQTDCGGDRDKCPSAKFTDVAPYGDWSHAGIDFCVDRGLFGGTTETTFEPETEMTRAMLVTVLWRYEGKPQDSGKQFKDVKSGDWFADAVLWASGNGIVNGVEGGKFDPDGIVTREQLATILYRYSEWKKLPTDKRADFSEFPDAGKVSSWARIAMQWAVAEGLIGGSKEGGKTYILPGNGATRAQVATILMRFIQNIK